MKSLRLRIRCWWYFGVLKRPYARPPILDNFYAAFAESLNRPELTKVEKQQAILNHIRNVPDDDEKGRFK